MKKTILTLVAMIASTLLVNAQTYSIGDIVEKGGNKGIVVKVDESGQHGLLMSIGVIYGDWFDFGMFKSSPEPIGVEDPNDGEVNTKKVYKIMEENPEKAKGYEIFSVLKNNFSEEWYIPSSNELLDIATALGGGALATTFKTIKEFDKKITDADGKSLFTNMGNFRQMYSSTEGVSKGAYCLYLKTKLLSKKATFETYEAIKNAGSKMEPETVGPGKKSKKEKLFGTRAVCKF